MKTFEHKGDTLAIVDGDLWLKLSAGATPPISLSEPPTSRGLKKSLKARKTRLGLDAKEAIGDEIRQGATAKEICKKYGISLPTFYIIRKTFGNRTVDRGVAKQAVNYRCDDDGFRFKSRLPRKEVICPQCRSENVKPVEEAPVREE